MCVSMWSMTLFLEQLLTYEPIYGNLRAVNNYSAMDFARKYGTSTIIDLLETHVV
jgi:hypothetical protein